MIGAGVPYIYIYIYVCGRKIYLNRTLVIDSPFQTFAVGLLRSRMLSSLSKSRISIFNAHPTPFVRRIMSHNSIGKYHHLVN